jgi:signal transduction histidine kinase
MSGEIEHNQDVDAPLPTAQFKRFLAIFHVVFLCGLAFSLVLRWRRPDLVWTWKDTVLVGLVTLQTALYLLFFVFLWKPPTALRWWVAYFALSFGIWLAEWQIENALQWTAFAYLGQMFGVLRPALSVPAAVGVFGTYFLMNFGGRDMNVWEWIGALSLAVTTMALGLFIHGLTVTSSERAKLIKQLEAAQKQLELSHERDTELAALRERERLARELHDSLGHGLVTLTVQLEAAQRLYQVDPQKASNLMDEMKQLTRTTMEQLRRSLSGLRTSGLGTQPLGLALEKLCAQSEQDGAIKAHCTIAKGTERLTPSVAEALWRVAQEGLRNAARHAQAKDVQLALELTPGEVVLTVTDDGVGLPKDAENRPGHFGLRGLRERVEGLGGTFGARQNGSGGTQLLVSIPIIPE